MITGMGGRGATVSSRSVGRQNLVDRTGSKHSLIRAVGGADILTWIDATTTSNKLGSNLTAATVDIVAGTEPVLGSNAPETVFSTVLNSTAYSFQSNESLKYNAGLFASNTGEVTIATRYCITGTPGNHILFELGNSNYHAIDGGMGLGAIEGGSPEVTRNWVAFGGQAPPATDGDTFILSDQVTQNTAQNIVATYAANVNPNALQCFKDGTLLAVNDDAEFNGPDTVNTANKAFLGCRAGDSSPSVALDGHISDFVIITRKLTLQEASRLGLSFSRNHGGTFSAATGGDEDTDTPIDFSTLSAPYGTALSNRTEGGTFCQPNGPSGFYSHNFNERISFEAPSGKRIRFTITSALLDSNNSQYGITFISPVGAGTGDALTSPVTIIGDSTAGSGFWGSNSVPFVAETPVGQNTADFWFSSNPFSQNVRNDGSFRVTVEFF